MVMKQISLHAPEKGFGFNEIVIAVLTAAVTGLEGLLTLGVFVHG
jgi:hypothetical protein